MVFFIGTKDKVLSTNPVVNTVANQTVDGNSLNEQQNSIQDHMSCITENTQQQQQISTVNIKHCKIIIWKTTSHIYL